MPQFTHVGGKGRGPDQDDGKDQVGVHGRPQCSMLVLVGGQHTKQYVTFGDIGHKWTSEDLGGHRRGGHGTTYKANIPPGNPVPTPSSF